MAGVGTIVSSILNPGGSSTSTSRISTAISSSTTKISSTSSASSTIATNLSSTATSSRKPSTSTTSDSSLSTTVIVVTVTTTTTLTTLSYPQSSSSPPSSNPSLSSSSSLISSISTTPVSISSELSSSSISLSTSRVPLSSSLQSTVSSITSAAPSSSSASILSVSSTGTATSSQSALSTSSSPASTSPRTSTVTQTTTSPSLIASSSTSSNAAGSVYSTSSSTLAISGVSSSSATLATGLASSSVAPAFPASSSSSFIVNSSSSTSASSSLSAPPLSISSSLSSFPTSSTSSTPSISSTVLSQPGNINPLASNNVAVYFGHSNGTYNASLADVCNSTSVDIVILGFVRWWWPKFYYPDIDFHTTCDSQDVASSKTTPKCPQMARWISDCQNAGKKVFLSIGGSASNTTLSTAQDAMDAATTLWYYFGEGNTFWSARPFGSITLDGFDFDIEVGSAQYYDVFAAQLRQFFSTATKRYYISAAPSCANRTASLQTPLTNSFYQQADFVWPRFYNSAACSIGNAGFNNSFSAWASYLGSVQGWAPQYPKLYASAFSWDCNKPGWLNRSALNRALTGALSIANGTNIFGGIMFWDGTKGVQNVLDGIDPLAAAKLILNTTLA